MINVINCLIVNLRVIENKPNAVITENNSIDVSSKPICKFSIIDHENKYFLVEKK